ncbi:hypothetical protein [Ligilactobacillus salivarius]|uniref:hypothetical protein n=1 Tax=Ligilactobacillus salivarius TaxID=1624 RepID=UPI00177DD87C|nr:hypothetical protein [Ligilactobacillus salivarius]
MPLPFIIGAAAAIAGAAGIGSGIHGGIKMKEAKDTMDVAKYIQERAVERYQKEDSKITKLMDSIGKQELEILNSFETFSDIIEKIQGRPEFKNFKKDGVKLLDYDAEELKEVSIGAGMLLGGIGGTTVGVAGAFAASGATTAAITALGTASTGTAISSLSGVAATNATLAALGGGMALGSAILGGATLGVGLLVGGIIFNVTGFKLSDQADEAYNQATRTEEEVDRIVKYLNELSRIARKFQTSLTEVEKQYRERLARLNQIVNISRKIYWDDFTDEEKLMTENAVLLVGLLYKMCKTRLVLKNEKEDEFNTINQEEVNAVVTDATEIMSKINVVGIERQQVENYKQKRNGHRRYR